VQLALWSRGHKQPGRSPLPGPRWAGTRQGDVIGPAQNDSVAGQQTRRGKLRPFKSLVHCRRSLANIFSQWAWPHAYLDGGVAAHIADTRGACLFQRQRTQPPVRLLLYPALLTATCTRFTLLLLRRHMSLSLENPDLGLKPQLFVSGAGGGHIGLVADTKRGPPSKDIHGERWQDNTFLYNFQERQIHAQKQHVHYGVAPLRSVPSQISVV
jgi:hypothetical protein